MKVNLSLKLLLLILGLVFFGLAALKVPEPRWFSWGWGGAFFISLVLFTAI